MSSQIPLRSAFRPPFLQTLLIIVAGFWVFAPAFHGDWLWDDNVLITTNPLMNDPAGLWKIWFQPGILIDYYPLTFTAQRLEWNLWGMDTLGYHLTNVVLHLVNAFLVWRLLSKLGLRLAWWGGLLFAIHPVMVESVAWIAELKNTLSLLPLLVAMCCWIDYDEHRRTGDYWLALVLFLIAMLGKTSVTMLPTIILLYAWWKRGRIEWHDLKTSAPFFAISLVLGFFELWLEHHHPGPAVVTVDWLSRVDTVGLQIFFYFFLCLFPLHLLPIYPNEMVTAQGAADLLIWLPLVGLLYLLWIKRGTWGRHLLLGLGFFLLNLVPALGFLLAGVTTMIWTMDHLVYLPIIGLIGLAVAGLGWLDGALPEPGRLLMMGTAATITALLAMESHAYAGIFSDSEVLWTYALRGNPDSWMVRANLAEAFSKRGRVAEAIEQLQTAIKINPSYDIAHYELGIALAGTGRDPEAISQFEAMLKLNPGYAGAYDQLGNAFARAHRIPEAIDQYEKAVQLNPGLAPAHYSLGVLLSDANQLSEAIDQFEQSMKIDPNHAEVHAALGNALLKTNRLPEAADQLAQALQLDPGDVKARSNLGVALARMGRLPEALEQFQAALRINPDDFEARNNLGSVFLVTGRFPEAIEQYRAALRLKPDSVDAKKNLARAQAMEKARGPAIPPP